MIYGDAIGILVQCDSCSAHLDLFDFTVGVCALFQTVYVHVKLQNLF